MKTISTFVFAPLIIGLGIAIAFLIRINHQDYSILQWCLAVVAILLAGLMVGGLLNFAIFAPIYWFLGRLQSKKTPIEKENGDNA